jgi:hypothetical protein
MEANEQLSWEKLSRDEKKHELFLRQKETLDLFLARGAISQAQYEKSLHDLTAKLQLLDAFAKSKLLKQGTSSTMQGPANSVPLMGLQCRVNILVPDIKSGHRCSYHLALQKIIVLHSYLQQKTMPRPLGAVGAWYSGAIRL